MKMEVDGEGAQVPGPKPDTEMADAEVKAEAPAAPAAQPGAAEESKPPVPAATDGAAADAAPVPEPTFDASGIKSALPAETMELLQKHAEFLHKSGRHGLDLDQAWLAAPAPWAFVLTCCAPWHAPPSAGQLRVHDLLLPLREYAQADNMMTYHLWVLVFPIVWTTLEKNQQVALAKPIISLLSKEYLQKQSHLRPNVIQVGRGWGDMCMREPFGCPVPTADQHLLSFADCSPHTVVFITHICMPYFYMVL